jgi:hypothetical protein
VFEEEFFMASARDFLKQAKQRSTNQEQDSLHTFIQPEPTIQMKSPEPEMTYEPVRQVAPAPVARKPVVKQNQDSLSSMVQKVARTDVPANVYGVKPVASQLNIYNKDLHRYLGSWSAENQFNGGTALNKSTLIEAILDFVYYDMQLEPEGFQSAEELREHLRSKIK